MWSPPPSVVAPPVARAGPFSIFVLKFWSQSKSCHCGIRKSAEEHKTDEALKTKAEAEMQIESLMIQLTLEKPVERQVVVLRNKQARKAKKLEEGPVP